jgi:3-oxoacyl-[acyl-carrier protein] reductase
MELHLHNKVALVTGASRGIGRAAALEFAREGADVGVNYVNSQTEAEQTVSEIRELGRRAIAIQADVADAAAVIRLVTTLRETFGGLDILVNNAGFLPRPGDWQHISEETWRATLDTNLTGVFNCIRTAAPLMAGKNFGRIINVSSTYGIFGSTNVVAYVAAKAGVINLTKSFAKELAPSITVNAVAPGHIHTDLTPKVPGFMEKISAMTPAGRIGQPDEVAALIVFLASERAAYITGQVVAVDGGHMLK